MDISHRDSLRRRVGAWMASAALLAIVGMSPGISHARTSTIHRAPSHVTVVGTVLRTRASIFEATIDTGELPDEREWSPLDLIPARVARVTPSRVTRCAGPPLVSGRHQHLRI